MSDKSKTPTVSPDLDKSGLQPFQAAAMQEILHQEPPDLVLFAGPMGAGMNTTGDLLRRMLAERNGKAGD